METKIKIKLGPVEVDYEGSEAFLKQELPELLKAVSELYKSNNIPLGTGDSGSDDGTGGQFNLSVGNVCAKLGGGSGPDVIVAAAASLNIVKKKVQFTRSELTEEMKLAVGYHKSSYIGNLTKNIGALVTQGKMIETSSGSYALAANHRLELEKKLAG